MAEPVRIEALVDAAERPAVIVAAQLLSEGLGAAAGAGPWPVQLNFRPADGAPVLDPLPTAIITSLLPEAATADEPLAGREARWNAWLTRLQATGAPVFLCLVFRQVADRPRDGGPSPVLERIRRLNRMALDLSHRTGATVIDIDRALAHVGARALASDYRLGSESAAEVAGHTIAWSLLSDGLDTVAPPEIQERARGFLGDLQQINTLVMRRQAGRAGAGGSGG